MRLQLHIQHFTACWFANNAMIIMELCNKAYSQFLMILHFKHLAWKVTILKIRPFELSYIRICYFVEQSFDNKTTEVWLMMIYLSPTLGFCLIFMSKLGTRGATSVGNFPRISRLIIISSLCSLCRLINFHSLKDVDIKRTIIVTEHLTSIIRFHGPRT